MHLPLSSTRRQFLATGSTLSAILASGTWAWANSTAAPEAVSYTPSLASDWLDIVQQICADDVERIGARPTILSRQMCIPLTAMYDAWSRYDTKANPVYATAIKRRPTAERAGHQSAAISFAVYRTMADLFPGDLATLDAFM